MLRIITVMVIVTLVFLHNTIYTRTAFANDAITDAEHFTVKIVVATEYPFGDESKGTAYGAGFLVDRKRGWILTNAHVAGRSPSSVRISFKDRPYVKAEKLHVDTHLDMAVLKIDPSVIPHEATPAPLQCAKEYPPGRPVIAFGHPWSLNYTATRGIISGTKVSRGVEALQTDAALNPGNSGGALIDAQTGFVVGINEASISRKLSQGLHFAVPIKLVCTVLDLLKQEKEPAPPILPISFGTTVRDKELVVSKVKDVWSQKLKIGDRILAVDGDRSARTVSRALDHMRGKDRVTLLVERNTKKHEVFVEIPRKKDVLKRRGIHVSGMIIGQKVNDEADPNKMYVQFVDDASLAEQSLFYRNDQISAIDAITIDSYEKLLKVLTQRNGREAEFIIKREHYSHTLEWYDYVVRKLRVEHIFEITENGAKPRR
ncbi:MAG: trypsin-like peptidase domain-containing protein [Alphaproteobacteria bacterium]